MSRDVLVVIPARWGSSRFPGKPLQPICGVPMVEVVWANCADAVGRENVIVATDDRRIYDWVEGYGGLAMMTPENCATGTDRVAEVAKAHPARLVVNVQGDEPTITPESIHSFIYESSYPWSCCYTRSSTMEVQMVVSERNTLQYADRRDLGTGLKQVGMYSFGSGLYRYFGAGKPRRTLEEKLDIEIMRLVDAGRDVRMCEVKQSTVPVDHPADLDKVEEWYDSHRFSS